MKTKTSLTFHAKLIFAIASIILILGCSFVNLNSEEETVHANATLENNNELIQTGTAPVSTNELPINNDLRYPIRSCEKLKYGYINQQGDLVIPHQFEDAGLFHEGLAVAGSIGEINPQTFELEDGKYGYIDLSGNYAIEPKFPSAAPFSEGLAAAASPENPKLFGYIDKTGQFVIEPKYFGNLSLARDESPSSMSFHEGYAVVPTIRKTVVDEYLYNYIDHNGSILSPPGPVRNATSFSNGLATIQTTTNETHIINKNGQSVAQVENCNFGCIGSFSEGLATIERTNNTTFTNQSGFIDEAGNVIISEIFADAKSFSEGLAAVQDVETQLWGYIDHSGKLVIPYKYSMASIFSEGFASVSYADYSSGGYIDKTGNMIIPFEKLAVPNTDIVFPISGEIFQNGLALIGDGYIDKSGNFIYKSDCSP